MYSPEKTEDDGFTVRYEFRDDSGREYMVQFKNDSTEARGRRILGKSCELAYYARNDRGEWDARVVSNSGSPFKTMDAVFGKALGMFLAENAWIRRIWMEGLPKPGERSPSKRTKLYARRLTMNPVSGFEMRSEGNLIELVKKDA